MVKYIIKRILIGTGIALALMFIKGGLVADVQAMEVHRSVPTIMGYSNSWSSNATAINNLETFTLSNIQIPFYGYTFPNNQTDTNRAYIWWHFGSNNSNLDISTPLDVHFIIYHGFLSSQFDNNSVQVFLRNNYNDNALTYACTTNTQADLTHSDTTLSTFGYFTTVHCDNVAFSTQNFRVQMISNFRLFQTGNVPVGISGVSIYPHSSNQSVVNAIDENTQATEDVNDTLNDNSTDDPTNDISSMNSKVASNNSITQLLTLPIQLYQNILNAVSGSCSSFSLGSLYGHNLVLPCINLQNLLGSTLYGIIDILISGLFILSFRKKMVDIFNNMTSLKDRGNELE